MSGYVLEDKLFGGDDTADYVSENKLFGPPKRTLAGTLKDVGVSAAKGMVNAGEAVVGLADIPTGGRVGKTLDSIGLNTKVARDFYDEQYSPAQQEANRNVEQAEGFMPTVKAYLENPSTIVHQTIEQLPAMALGGAGGAALKTGVTKLAPTIASKVAPSTLGVLAGAAGEGLISAGQQEEQIRQQSKDGTTTAKQGLMAAGSGLGTGIFGFVGGRLAQKLGFADIDTMLATGNLATTTGKGVQAISSGLQKAKLPKTASDVIARIVGGGISESVFEEMPQSIQEQIWQNAATDRPLLEGTGTAAGAGGVLGAAMGAGANLLPGKEPQSVDQPTQETAKPADTTTSDATQPGGEPVPGQGQPVETTTPNRLGTVQGAVASDQPQMPAAAPGQTESPQEHGAGGVSDSLANAVSGQPVQQSPSADPLENEVNALFNESLSVEPSGAVSQVAQESMDIFGQPSTAQQSAEAMAQQQPEGSGLQHGGSITDMGELPEWSETVTNPVTPAVDTTLPNSERHEVIDNPDSVAHGHEVNTQPSEAQKEAENYKTAKVNVDGLKLSIENPTGSVRSGTDPDGKTWSQEMKADYGRILGSRGYDKDHVDIFIAPGYQGGAQDVFIVNQHKKDGSFDEHKAVLGVQNEAEAMALYNSNYEPGWDGGKSVVRMPMDDFKDWAMSYGPEYGPVEARKIDTTPVVAHEPPPGEIQDNTSSASTAPAASEPQGVTYPAVKESLTPQPDLPSAETATEAVSNNGAQPDLVEHTTKKGKVIKGVVRKDLTLEQAKAIDKFTFKKDGGFFIREKYLEQPQEKIDPGSKTSETSENSKIGNETVSDRENQNVKGQDDWFDDKGDFTLQSAREHLRHLEKQRSEFERTEIAAGRVPVFDAWKERKIREAKELVTQLEKEAQPEEAVEEQSPINQPSIKSKEEKQEDGPDVQLKPSAKSSKSDEGSAPAMPKAETSYGGNNKVVTPDKYAEIKAKLLAKAKELRAGVDPELFYLGVQASLYHVEAGARKFSDYAKIMLEEFGEVFRSRLKQWYNAVRDEPGFDTTGMDSYDDVRAVQPGKEEFSPKALTSEKRSDTVEEKGEKADEQLQTDDGGIPAAARPGRPEADGERGSVGGVPGGDREGSPGDGANDLQADDGRPAGGRPEKKAGRKPGSGRGKGDIDQLPERVPDQSVATNYTITDADNLGKGGAKTKARDNIRAIEILKDLRQTGKPATKEQQAALVKYVGWGASELANGIFPTKKYDYASRKVVDHFKDDWRELGEQLKELLTPSEYAEAQGSTLNAHYTSQDVIEAMFRALERFGFDGKGRILEPGCGIGNFIGLLPEKFQQARFTGIEMDPTTAGIASLLYPGHDVRTMDFADFKAPNNFYDIAIGNPPFLDVKVTGDPDYAKQKFLVHDFFFAKSIDKVRPGGLLMLVTSKGTMDKANDRARTYLSKRADLVGAIRLPQTAFKENAGTEVVTDVIFLRKRAEGEQPAGESWADLREVETKDGDTVHVNEYFANHPEMVLGHHSTKGTMYGPGQYTVEPKDGAIADQFDEAVKNLPAGIYKKDAGRVVDQPGRVETEFAPDTIKEGGFFLKDGNLFQKENGVGVSVSASGAKKAIIREFIPLRDAVRNVLYVQMTSEDPGVLKAAQKDLNKLYDKFVGKYGPINKHRTTTRALKDGTESTSTQYVNFSHFKSDPDAYLVASIERYDLDTGKATKADIFTERVIDSPREPKIETATDALHVSLYRTGAVDLPLMVELLGQSEKDILAALDDILFLDPDGHRWVTNDEYLSGNVKKKLAEAKAAVEVDKKFQKNVEALEKIQPEDIPQSRIDVNLGMPLFDPEHIINFAQDVLGMGVNASYLSLDGSWKVDPFSGHGTAKATSDYGTARANASSLLEAALNNITPKIFDYDENRKPILNKDETEAAVEKQKKIKAVFKEWVWTDQKTADTIAHRFNDQYNNTVKREFGGEYLKQMQFPGMSKVKNPFDHQRRVAWRIIQRGNTYMAHSVGAGKTIASIIAGQEMKRLGIKKKPVWVVPGHMLKQFAGEFLELYPAAKILVADEEQFSKENRNRFMGRVASENWDGIIITHSAFGKIPMSASFQGQFIDEQLQDIELLLAESSGDRMKRKQLERLKKRLEARLKKVLDAANKDKGVEFEETGIDQIFVDEAHEFRKLDFTTNQTDIRGIDPAGSLRSFDLYVKTKYLETLSPGRSLVLMSGTPITNTLGEVFTIQRYLQEDKLRELGLNHFDSWAATFGGMVTNIEQTPGGSYKPVSRFGDFSNLQSLCAMWAEIGDFVHARDLNYIKRPKVRGGGRKLVVGETGQLQRDYKKGLADRVKLIEARKRPPKKGDDIILSVITDGRHAALDDRYIDPNAPLQQDSKTAKMVDKAMEIYRRTTKDRGTQMIFADLGLPSSEGKRGFSLYNFIRDQLIANGVPANEIAFMQDYKKSDQKRKLFQDMNEGKVRFLIGSSIAMGTGVNAQKKLVALHHFDADTYLPANIEQREGRMIRQGNENAEVELYAYIARGSYDETMWQFLETKQRFIDDFLAGNVSVDKAADIDGAADSFAEAKALSSDNPLAIELAGVNNELSRLESLYTAFRKDQQTLQMKRDVAQAGIPRLEEKIANMERAAEKLIPTKGDSFKATVSGKNYDDRESAGKALLHEVELILPENDQMTIKDIGSMGGFAIRIKKTIMAVGNKPWIELSMIDRGGTEIATPWREVDLEHLADVSGVGLVMKLENGLSEIRSTIESIKESVRANRRQIEEAEARIGQEFEYMEMLRDKRKRRDEIEKELAAQDKAAAVEESEEESAGDTRKSETSTSIFTPADVKAELSAELGSGADALIKSGAVRIVTPERARRMNRKSGAIGKVTQAWTTGAGKVYLVQGDIPKGQAYAVLMHELGDHAGKLLHNDAEFKAILKSIERRSDHHSETGLAIRWAMKKVTRAKTDPYYWEEVSAYMVEMNPETTIARRIIAMVKRILLKLGISPDILTAKDIAALADIAVRRRARLAKAEVQGKTGGNVTDQPTLLSERDAAPLSAAFRRWFGASKITRNGQPYVMYHGTSDQRFLTDPAYNWTFDTDRATRAGSSPLAGLGIFLGDKTIADAHSVGTPGTTHPFFVRIERPYVTTAEALQKKVSTIAAAKALRKRLEELEDYDGIIVKDRGQAIAFTPNQLKSAIDNTGVYSLTNDDVRYSERAAEAYDTDIKESAGTFYEKIHDKPDIPFLARIFSTPEYYFKSFPATWKMFNAQLDRHKQKFNLENDMLGDFVPVFTKAQKENEAAYNQVQEYLVDTDRTGKSYRLKHEQKWEVKDDEGNIVGYTNLKRDGEKLAREDAKERGKHIKDYKPEKIDIWTVIDPKGQEGDQFLSEKEAIEAMESAEYHDLVNAGWSKEAAGLVRRFRQMTNTVFDYMIADLRKILDETSALELPEPTVEVPEEERRWAVLEDNIEIASFTTEADAWAAIKAKMAGVKATKTKDRARYDVRKKTDGEIMKQVKLSEMIAMMSDLRGQYFPRQRKPGGVILRAVKGDDKIMEKFDLYLTGRKIIDAETGEQQTRPMSEWLRKAFNQATGFIPFVDTLEKRARQLRAQGYDIVVEKDTSPPESVFDVMQLSSSVDALLREAIGNAKKKQGLNETALLEINKILTANIADLFKARGYLSSRLRRSADYWRGFEEDPLLAGTQYARGIAAGIAKRDSAKKMMAALTGRDKSWTDYKKENPDKPADELWAEYDAMVEENRLDPNKQPKLHAEALGFMKEVLRNEEQIDRVIGTMRGLATIKFLGGRVSSAAVNLTNMIMAVPATISSQSGGSIPDALRAVRRAAVQYGKFRLGKEMAEEDRNIFLTIANNGWDQAQFNMENAAVLMSKAGRGWAKFCELAMYMFGATERANRAMTIFAAYKEIVANSSLRGQEALEKAKHISDRAHGIYGKETIPSWVRGSANPLRLTYTFQKFSHNYMLNMLEMGLKGDRKQTAYMLLSPVLMGGAGATLATPIIAMIAKGLGAGDDPEEEFYDWVAETFGSDAVARHGLPGMVGINLKGSIEMNNPIPTTMGELFGAPQAIVKDTVKAVEYAGKGELMKAGEALLPTAIGSAIRAAREGSEGITTGSYSPVFYGDEPLRASTAEQFVRALSFNPSRISGIREKQWHEKQVAAKYTSRRADIIEKFKRYYIYGDGNYYELMKEFNRYNELVVGSGRNDLPRLSMPNVRRAVRMATKPSRTERLRA